MDNFELCEKLVNKTGISFAQAKDALERSGWDMLDAMVLLEKEGTIGSAGERYSSQGTADAQQTAANDHQVLQAEVITGKQQEKRQNKESRQSKAKDDFRTFCRKAGQFLTGNRLIACNNVGKEVLNMPIWIAILVFCCTFWFSIILILISFVKGWQYRFAGPELGKDGVNRAADAVGSAVYSAGRDIKKSWDNMNNHDDSQDPGCSN